MKKQTKTALLSLALIGTMAVPAFAAGNAPQPNKNLKPVIAENPTAVSERDETHQYPIVVNGQELKVDACVIVPLRAVAEPLGFAVEWKDGTVLVDNGVIHTVVTIGVDRYNITTSKQNLVGMSAPFSLGAAPYVKDGVTYVPLGLFHALLGNKEGAVSLNDNKVVIRTMTTQIPNPFVTCKDLKEAQELVGFSLTPPSQFPNWLNETVFRASKSSQMIEVIFSSADDEKEITLRKAAGTEDVSGDYTQYKEVQAVDVDGVQVTMKGDDGKVKVAIWTKDGYTYAMNMKPGMDCKEVSAMVSTVR